MRVNLSDAAKGFPDWCMQHFAHLIPACCVPAVALSTWEEAGKAAAPGLLILPGFTCLWGKLFI